MPAATQVRSWERPQVRRPTHAYQRWRLTVRVADEAEQRAALAHAVRRPLGLDPLVGERRERRLHVVDRQRNVAVPGADLVRVDAEVVGELQLRLLLARDAEEVVDGLVADRQLPP